ncbi:MAG: glycoside hydrolase family 3 C-terminal domain-containing protein [Bacteroidaceae bacterium]|nr:glycoside hydrolase family 3 C-terminal domain-containing protein [Bacteroidaceae bacterium]
MKQNTKRNLRGIIAGASLLFGVTATAQNAPQLRADNIDEVLKAMTLEEKASLLVGGSFDFFEGGANVGGSSATVPGAAGSTAEIKRLGIPATVLTDGPAGVRIFPTREGDTRTYYATAFPIGTSLASTWNTELVEEIGKAIGNETKEYKCDVILGPGMNLHRNPLCGRNFEYFSEDPLLTGKIAAAYVRGVQSEGAGTSVKHFAVNSQETERMSIDERVSQRALREIYLRGFEIVVRESDPWTVMASYNKVNGTFTQESRDLLTDILRTDWGYKGMVMTDWIGKRNTAGQVHAGNDLMEPGQPQQVNEILEKVKSGELDIKDVDTNVRRILEYIVKTPSFKKYAASDAPDLKAHAVVTRRAANEGMVLLKNSKATLPLSSDVKSIALFGVSSYEFLSGGVGSGCVHPPYVVDMVEGLNNAGIKTNDKLTDVYKKYIDYAKVKFEMDRHPSKWFQAPHMGQQKYPEIEIAPYSLVKGEAEADAAIVTIGRQAGEGIDRDIETEFNLTAQEHELIKTVSSYFHSQNKPVIVVINSGSVIETASWKQDVDAILVAWQPGMEGGNSVADILTGKTSPSGKLTMTWPNNASDHPSTANYPTDMDIYTYNSMVDYGGAPGYQYSTHEEDIYVGYRYFDSFNREVSYPFGYGLSYTNFEYSKPKVVRKGETIEVSVTVKNSGKAAGKEVVQVYAVAPEGKLEKPAKELKAFGKTRELNPGESQTLTMTLQRRELASYDEDQSAWVVDAGNYDFLIAASAADIRHRVSLRLDGMTEKTTNALAPQQPIKRLSKNAK